MASQSGSMSVSSWLVNLVEYAVEFIGRSFLNKNFTSETSVSSAALQQRKNWIWLWGSNVGRVLLFNQDLVALLTIRRKLWTMTNERKGQQKAMETPCYKAPLRRRSRNHYWGRRWNQTITEGDNTVEHVGDRNWYKKENHVTMEVESVYQWRERVHFLHGKEKGGNLRNGNGRRR